MPAEILPHERVLAQFDTVVFGPRPTRNLIFRRWEPNDGPMVIYLIDIDRQYEGKTKAVLEELSAIAGLSMSVTREFPRANVFPAF